MENEVLDWATVVCSKRIASVGSGRERTIENNYRIAVDVNRLDGDSFICPCCGEELTYGILSGSRIPEYIKEEIVQEKQDGGLRSLKIFALLCAALIAGIAGWMFLAGSLSTAVGYIILLVFAVAWIPGLLYLIWTAVLLRDRERIVRVYEEVNPVIVSLRGCKDGIHRFEDFPEIYIDEMQSQDYELSPDI